MRVLLLGCNGQVGFAMTELIRQQEDMEYVALNRRALDLSDYTAIPAKLARLGHFDWIINAMAYTAVDKAESEPAIANVVNHLALGEIAQFAFTHNSRVLHFSTDYVFDGNTEIPYAETSVPNPINVYGKTKLAGERALQKYQPNHVIIRTSWIFSAYRHNFLKTILHLLQTKSSLDIISDQQGTPTAAKDLVRVSVDLLRMPIQSGTYHYCSGDATTWYGFAAYIKERMVSKKDILCKEIKPIKTVEYPLPAKRPLYSILSTEKIQACGINVHPWQNYVDEAIDNVVGEK